MSEKTIAGLRQLAQQAMRRYRDGIGLNQAVTTTLRDQDLTDEQVKRVVEETNVAAYLEEFQRGGDRRNVVFPTGPADPSVVLAELRDEGVKLPTRPTMSETKKVAGRTPVETTTKAEHQYDSLVKQGSILSRRASEAESVYHDCVHMLVGAVKLAQAAGVSGSDVRAAVLESARTTWGANLALQEVDRYLDIGHGTKTAGRLAEDHPVVVAVRKLEKNAYDLRVTKEAMRETEREVADFLESLSSLGV